MNKTQLTERGSAGIGDPYWYEWGIGLLKAAEMLNPDSGIEAVAFQHEGVKGWDDVVIRFRSGHTDYYQVKHSRPRTNLTFSDLVTKTDEQQSLLASLATAWHTMKLCGTDASCILITNREYGTKAGRSKNGTYRPPLEKFIKHISSELKNVASLGDVSVPETWSDAWNLWQSELGSIPVDEKLCFLRSMTITTEAPQLEELEAKLAESLAASFVITVKQAMPLVKNLLAALLKWTTSLRNDQVWISPEDVMTTFAEPDREIFGFCDVPTPVPFFPSREKVVKDITELLSGNEKHSVVFLWADPGAGKTSVVSRIVNQRVADYSTLVVDLRYYAYRPITPDTPTLPVDADLSASPSSLWYTLLGQIRERLKGRLVELHVPVRNNFLTHDQARDHVLRLAAVLAKEKCSAFVIVIDGIDHAARAQRKGLPSLLGSLPAPETIPEGVKILIAGQPALGYPEYPIWLRTPDKLVTPVGLGVIDETDIQLLISSSISGIPPENQKHAARIILNKASGNTLAAVFSVAEAESCKTLEELEERLSCRQLNSGVHAYYMTIWKAAIPDSYSGAAVYLATVFCFLRERITGVIMHKAFPAWEKAAPEWDAVLRSLEPLVVRDDNGYRVRHNDIRVFWERELRSDVVAFQQVTSLLADYYLGPEADPFFRQESVFTLLRLAGRDQDTARIFNPAWVLDAAAFGRELPIIYQEAEDAFRALPDVKDWGIALSVACGGLTLTKLSDCLDTFQDIQDITDTPQVPVPQCLTTERFVRPFNCWDENTMREVLSHARMLSQRSELSRARGLIEHWFAGVSPAQVVACVSGIKNKWAHQEEPELAHGVDSLFKNWGAIVFKVGITTDRGNPSESLEKEATCLFEKGWVTECIALSAPDSVYPALNSFQPLYLNTYEVAVEETSKKCMWEVVEKLLKEMSEQRSCFQPEFRVKAIYWALKAMGHDTSKEWLEALPEASTGRFADTHIDVPLMVYVAKAIGWVEPQRDASAIASQLATAIINLHRHHERTRSSLLLHLRVAAMVGLIERMLSRNDLAGVAVLVPAQVIRKVIEVVWDRTSPSVYYEFHSQVLDLTFELIELCQKIGKEHSEMILSLSLSEAVKFPVGRKMTVLWQVLQIAGRRDVLLDWAVHWIGEEGAVWSGDAYSERVEIIDSISRLAVEEGWNEMASSAKARLRHHLLDYSSHKDYSFQEPLDWIKELFRSAPSTWREEGLELLDICRVCEAQGGDNRLSNEIKNEVATAAFHCGPVHAWSFFNCIDPEYERYWLHSVRDNLITASKRVIEDKVVKDHSDILALWSCAVGLTRWFDMNQVQTLNSFYNTIITALPSEDRADFDNRLKRLTPGECLRVKFDKGRQRSGSNEDDGVPMASATTAVVDDVAELGRRTAKGEETSLLEISRLAIRITWDNPVNRAELLSELFGMIDANSGYVTRWDDWIHHHPLRDIVFAIKESEAWELIRAAVRSMDAAHWSRSMSCNVHLICLYRAATEGPDILRKGTQRVFAMHRLWAGHPKHQRTIKRGRPALNGVKTWPDFAAWVLRCLLTADSSETVSSALRGLCAVIEVVPSTLATLFDDSDGKQLSMLLLGSEVWASRHPEEISKMLGILWDRRYDLSMRDRIQLWLCWQAYVRQRGGVGSAETFMAMPYGEALGPRTGTILKKPRKLLEMNPRVHGSIRLANTFSAARNWISRLGKITGIDMEDLESAIADLIDAQDTKSDRNERTDKKKYFADEEGDMIITSGVDATLDDALELVFHKPEWSEADAGSIAIALTHGDDPWVLKQSPLPSPDSFNWPEHDAVEEWLKNGADKRKVLNSLRLLARGEDLQEGYRVLGSYLRLCTTHHDCEMWYWLEVARPDGIVTRKALPSPSGRCFQFFLPNRFEVREAGRKPLVMFPRSFLRLSFSTLEVVPAKTLQDNFGWSPMPSNPLEWWHKGCVIAKYESYHGPLDYNCSKRHMRQPTLSRWVVTDDALADIGSLSPQWDLENHPYDCD